VIKHKDLIDAITPALDKKTDCISMNVPKTEVQERQI
jgi:hypothetical protein